ncbi:Flp pilus assembly protein CpaB [Arthrobacter sp. OAP107]|uniref:Flp pilus assembly protein CpaB n=1 Tax=Arthrobacter sp. OAP107 TaxID=3156445 RepID=UPI003392E7F0
MKSRIIAGVVAVLLATVGTVLLLSYVAGADQRALAGTQTVEVLVVNKGVPAGTPAKSLADSVGRQSVPAKVRPKDAVTSLAELGDQVTTVELVAGEQLIKSRFLDPAAIKGEEAVTVPKGMQEISVQLEPQRIVGGQLQPGDTVGIFMSLKPGDSGVPVTHLIFHKVLVTGVQGLAVPTKADATASPTAAPVPSGSVIVTLARTGADAEKVVFAQEFGTIWLSKEPSTASETGTRQLTAKDLFK